MNSKEFEKVMSNQLNLCTSILLRKAGEYASDDDRLHNFHAAAKLTGKTPREALAGMMLKHTVSVYDLCYAPANAPTALWEEKITDSINYLLLLRAIVEEEANDKGKE